MNKQTGINSVQRQRLKNLLVNKFLPLVTLIVLYALLFSIPITLVAQEQAIAAQEKNTGLAQKVSNERQKELKYMVQQDCGSCHGMTLKGGLGPSLLAQRVSVLPKQYLIEAITHGRTSTPMPPWEPILTKNEIVWIVEQLQLGQLGQSTQKNN